MDLDSIINQMADQADGILDTVTSQKEARTALSEHLESVHGNLNEDERIIVVAGVMSILEEEGFFTVAPPETDSVWGENDEPGLRPAD